MEPQLQKGQYVEKRLAVDPTAATVKEDDDSGDKQIRMPVSSTATDRDGDEFSREGLEDMKRQIDTGKIPMFLDHGRGGDGPYYGANGIVGRWDSAEIETESYEDKSDGEEKTIDVLYATGTPDSGDDDAMKMLGKIERDMPLGSSVGFRIIDYEYDDNEGKYVFNSTDLLEISNVGIPSNPITVNDGSGAVVARGYGERMGPRVDNRQPRQPAQFGQPQLQRSQQLAELNRLQEQNQRFYGAQPIQAAPPQPQAERSPGGTMGDNETNDTNDDVTEHLRELTNAVAKQGESIETLASAIEAGKSEPEEDAEPRELSVILENSNNEKAVEEFEKLKELANDDGEVKLADSETQLFASKDTETDDNTTSSNGGLI